MGIRIGIPTEILWEWNGNSLPTANPAVNRLPNNFSKFAEVAICTKSSTNINQEIQTNTFLFKHVVKLIDPTCKFSSWILLLLKPDKRIIIRSETVALANFSAAAICDSQQSSPSTHFNHRVVLYEVISAVEETK